MDRWNYEAKAGETISAIAMTKWPILFNMGLYKCDNEVRVYIPLMTIAYSSIISKNRGYNCKFITHIRIK